MSRAVVLAAGAAVLVLVALAAGSGPADRLEQRTIDSRFGLRADTNDDDLAVIAIDDKTFSDVERQWPLPRSLHAQALDRLRAAGVRQIVYDVQFTEPSNRPGQDLALFEAVRRARGTILATGESDALGRTRVLGGDRQLASIGAQAAAANLESEAGGVIRRYTRSVERLDTIATVVARRLGEGVPADRFGDDGALIDFAGPAGTIDTHSFSDLIAGRVPERELRDRIVVVGATSPSLQDIRPTSAGGERRMAGPEIQANAIRTALAGNPLQEAPGWARHVLLLLIGGVGVAAVLLLGPLRGAAAATAAAVAYAVAAQIAFTQGLVLPVAVPLLGLGAATIAAVLASTAREMAERSRTAGRNVELEDAVRARTAQLELTQLEAVDRLARAAELRDGLTGEHLERMSHMCELVALELGQAPATARLLRQAAVLHDVGKIGMPDRILNKPGRLTEEETAIMRRHTTEGAALLENSQSPLMRLAEVVALHHHERWDGAGYPQGLREDEIPIAGRIAAVCDVFDALITERAYKRAWTKAEALAEIEAQGGRHFDPRVTRAFLKVAGKPASAPAEAVASGRSG